MPPPDLHTPRLPAQQCIPRTIIDAHVASYTCAQRVAENFKKKKKEKRPLRHLRDTKQKSAICTSQSVFSPAFDAQRATQNRRWVQTSARVCPQKIPASNRHPPRYQVTVTSHSLTRKHEANSILGTVHRGSVLSTSRESRQQDYRKFMVSDSPPSGLLFYSPLSCICLVFVPWGGRGEWWQPVDRVSRIWKPKYDPSEIRK
jgi:hypothetical protein